MRRGGWGRGPNSAAATYLLEQREHARGGQGNAALIGKHLLGNTWGFKKRGFAGFAPGVPGVWVRGGVGTAWVASQR